MEKIVLATVDGFEITREDMLQIITNMPNEARMQVSTAEGRKALLDEMIAGELMYKKAIADGLDKDEKYIKLVNEAKKSILEQYAITKLLSTIKVTDEEMKAYYEEHKNEFTKGESVSAKHILTKELEEIEQVKKEIEEGLSFEDAAKKHSTCPSKERGGDLGSFSRGQMVKEFEDVAFASEIGEISEPVKTQFGYHLIMVSEKTEASIREYEEVKSGIEQTLLMEKQRTVYYENNKKLKEGHDIQIFEETLA